MTDLDKLGKSLLRFPNVKGYAKTLQKRHRKKEILEELCLQIHVSKKVPEKRLGKLDILPKVLEGIPIDVIYTGPHIIPLPPKPRNFVADISKTEKVRPLVAGISIGNKAITAGTLGDFMEKTKSPDKNQTFVASNGHVIADNPMAEVSLEKDIVQPGVYDGGIEVVMEYYWHKQLFAENQPSDCVISQGVADGLNAISWMANRQTRFIPIVQVMNHIDIGRARVLDGIPFEDRFIDVEFPPDKFGFVARGFAGSDATSLHSKHEWITPEGYHPTRHECLSVETGKIIHKTGRSSCYTTAPVIAESVYEIVGYGNLRVPFDDVLLSNKILDPGDSGSGIFAEFD